jgi:hypothetical protein
VTKDDEVGNGWLKRNTDRVWVGKLEGKGHLKGLKEEGRIIIKRVLKK